MQEKEKFAGPLTSSTAASARMVSNTADDNSRQELITLALLHVDLASRWRDEFKLAMDFLASLNVSSVPGVVASKHAQLLNGRTR